MAWLWILHKSLMTAHDGVTQYLSQVGSDSSCLPYRPFAH